MTRDFVFALAFFALVVFTLANIRSVLHVSGANCWEFRIRKEEQIYDGSSTGGGVMSEPGPQTSFAWLVFLNSSIAKDTLVGHLSRTCMLLFLERGAC